MDITSDWFWEGNVVDALCSHLDQEGWRIAAKANTHMKERGPDIRAEHSGRTLLIEAKGYPSKFYRNPSRAGDIQPTNPANQAQQWYAHAILKAMRLQAKHPDAEVALALPGFPRYRTLFAETSQGFTTLRVAVFTVQPDGLVVSWGLQPLQAPHRDPHPHSGTDNFR